MKNLNLLLLLMTALAISCSSSGEAVDALEKIHGLDGDVAIDATGDGESAPAPLVYRTAITLYGEDEPEEIEDPVAFCREQIASLGESKFESQKERGSIVAILAFAALRSPSSLVRADAVKVLTIICRDELAGWSRTGDAVDPAAQIEQFRSICTPGTGSGIATAGKARDELAALYRFFQGARFERSSEALALLDILTGTDGPADGNDFLRGRSEEAIRAVAAETFFLTARQALFDPAPVVRHEAVDAFCLFDLPLIVPALTDLMEHMTTPLLRIRVLKNLKTKKPSPVGLGPALMTQVAVTLEYSDPSAIFHAVELLKAMTGTENSDAGFWRAWWKEYLVKHVDELDERE